MNTSTILLVGGAVLAVYWITQNKPMVITVPAAGNVTREAAGQFEKIGNAADTLIDALNVKRWL